MILLLSCWILIVLLNNVTDHISNHIIKELIPYVFLLYCTHQYFYRHRPYHSKYSIKALGSLQCFKPIFLRLLIKNWYFTSYGSFLYNKSYKYLADGLLHLAMHFFTWSRTSNYYCSIWIVREIWSFWIMFAFSFSCGYKCIELIDT